MWNSRTIIVQKWNRDGRTVKHLTVEEWNRDGGIVDHLTVEELNM